MVVVAFLLLLLLAVAVIISRSAVVLQYYNRECSNHDHPIFFPQLSTQEPFFSPSVTFLSQVSKL